MPAVAPLHVYYYQIKIFNFSFALIIGSGKTQLCMMACARAAARKARVLYIDTSNSFSSTRIVTMLKAIPDAKDASSI